MKFSLILFHVKPPPAIDASCLFTVAFISCVRLPVSGGLVSAASELVGVLRS